MERADLDPHRPLILIGLLEAILGILQTAYGNAKKLRFRHLRQPQSFCRPAGNVLALRGHAAARNLEARIPSARCPYARALLLWMGWPSPRFFSSPSSTRFPAWALLPLCCRYFSLRYRPFHTILAKQTLPADFHSRPGQFRGTVFFSAAVRRFHSPLRRFAYLERTFPPIPAARSGRRRHPCSVTFPFSAADTAHTSPLSCAIRLPLLSPPSILSTMTTCN